MAAFRGCARLARPSTFIASLRARSNSSTAGSTKAASSSTSAGINSISAAEALKGLIVAIPRAERAPLPGDEVYISDLIGCTLVDVGCAVPIIIGRIEDVDRSAGPAPLLVLRGPLGEILIPFAKNFLRRVDLASRQVEMALPDGLVELNARDET